MEIKSTLYYSRRNESDFQDYWNNYAYRFYRVTEGDISCQTDFCKSGLSKSAPFVIHKNIISSLISLYKHRNKDVFIIEMDIGNIKII